MPENKWKLTKDAMPSVNLIKPEKSLTTCQKQRELKSIKKENVALVEKIVEVAGLEAANIEPVQEVQRVKTVSTQITR